MNTEKDFLTVQRRLVSQCIVQNDKHVLGGKMFVYTQ